MEEFSIEHLNSLVEYTIVYSDDTRFTFEISQEIKT